jgi:hypothetical protein
MTDEKLRLQKRPGYRIYSPVPASGVRAMTNDIDLCATLRTAAQGEPDIWRKEIEEAADRIDALAARLAEAEGLLRAAWLLGLFRDCVPGTVGGQLREEVDAALKRAADSADATSAAAPHEV